MSIILDALKKAEKERSNDNPPEAKPIFNPLVTDGKKSGGSKKGGPSKNTQYILLVLCVVALGGIYYFGFYKKSHNTGPVAKAPLTGQKTPSETIPPPTQEPPKQLTDAEKVREEALKAFESSDYEKSRLLWERLTLLTPTDPEVYNNLGVVLKKLGNEDEARDAYKKALELNAEYPEALNNLGVILMEERAVEQAKDLFNKAIAMKRDYAEPFFHLALLAESTSDFSGAIKNYQKFLELAPKTDEKLKSDILARIKSLENY